MIRLLLSITHFWARRRTFARPSNPIASHSGCALRPRAASGSRDRGHRLGGGWIPGRRRGAAERRRHRPGGGRRGGRLGHLVEGDRGPRMIVGVIEDGALVTAAREVDPRRGERLADLERG